ncbi:MAG: PAS domain-containing protein [Labilithrix sp.]|nr:PAS domain-containing protein [Labilithrix sp.]
MSGHPIRAGAHRHEPPRPRAKERPSDDGALAEASPATTLLERESFHRAILDGVALGVVTTEPSGTVTFINRAARALLGVRWSSGGDVRDLLGLHSSPRELVSSTPKLAYTLPRRGGDALDLELTVDCARGCGGVAAGYFFIFRDVSEEKSRSAERERFERLVAIGTMVAGFAHEVRNPVASLRSLAESLAEDLADAKLNLPHVSRMLQVLERIERLVRTSLQFGRPAAPRRGRHRPWTILAAALGEVGPRTHGRGGEGRLEVEPDLPDVFVDDGQCVQVLVILLNNALDSVGAPQRVLVRVFRAGRARQPSAPVGGQTAREGAHSAWVRFEVQDDGVGIPAAILGRIFDPFFTTKPSGTGLGLSIAQHIVSENGGSLGVTSARGGPTIFDVSFPSS